MIKRINTLEQRSALFRAFQTTPGGIVLAVLFLAGGSYASIPSSELSLAALQFELAGTTDGALSILRTFVDEGIIERVKWSLFADFFFILGYSFGLAAIAWHEGKRTAQDPDTLVHHVVWGALWAGLLDELENGALLWMLWQFNTSSDPNLGVAALLSTLFAVTKWTFVVGVGAHVLWTLFRQTLGFLRPEPEDRGTGTGSGGGGGEVETTVRKTPPKPYPVVEEPKVDEPDAGERPVKVPPGPGEPGEPPVEVPPDPEETPLEAPVDPDGDEVEVPEIKPVRVPEVPVPV